MSGGAAPPAYQQLADDLRRRILAGDLAPGSRLPGESELGATHEVSRSTVREAIRLLEAQHLVVTTRGTTGGSFVTHQRAERISEELLTSLELLVGADAVSVEQVVEARRLLEVPAAALAAARRTQVHLDELAGCVDAGRGADRRFHRTLLAAADNPLVEMMTTPLFAVISHRVVREPAAPEFWDQVHRDHRELLELVRDGDADGAASAMGAHLDLIAGIYRVPSTEARR